MPTLHIPPSGILLASSQDAARTDFAPADVFGLTLSDNVIEDMIKCVRSGKSIQLSLGNDPKVCYGTKTQNLSSSFDPFEHEYYRTAMPPASSQSGARAAKPFCSLFGKASGPNYQPRAAPKTSVKAAGMAKATTSDGGTLDMAVASGTDAALTALKNSLASENARKKDNTTVYVKDTSTLPPAIQQRGSAQPIKSGNKARFLAQNKKSLAGGTTRSVPSSPGPGGVGSPSMAPTSVPMSQQLAEKAKTIRKPIIHQLALGPATESQLFNFRDSDVTDQDFKLAIEKVADLDGGKWKLKHKSFRDLDVFTYKKYSSEERQIAIDNTIRTYDKLRLNASEAEWERLLPYEERGTGKILSKLQAKIATGPIKAPKINVQRAEDTGHDTPADHNTDQDSLGAKQSSISKGGETMSRSSSQPLMKPKKLSEKEAQAKRLLAKPGKKVTTKATEKKPAAKETGKVKSAQFVSDSDEEEIHPNLTASTPTIKATYHSNTINKPATKRAREETEDTITVQAKKHKGASPHKSSPLASSPPANASDISDSSLSSLESSHKRSAELSSDAAPEAKRHHKSSSISTTSSAASGNISPSRREMIIEKSKRFKVYYQKYVKLHRELSADSKRDADKMEYLLDMQDRLTEMKKEILRAAET